MIGVGNYNHHHNQAANIVHQELAIKYGLSMGWKISYYKYEPNSVLRNCNYKLYYIRPIELSLKVDRN